MIVVAKGDSLLNLGAYQEMIDLDSMIKQDVYSNMSDVRDKNDNILFAGGYDAYYGDICERYVPSYTQS